MIEDDPSWPPLLEAERIGVATEALSRADAVAELAQCLHRLQRLLDRPAELLPADVLDRLDELARTHDTYGWDQLGIFSREDVLDTLAYARACEKALAARASDDEPSA